MKMAWNLPKTDTGVMMIPMGEIRLHRTDPALVPDKDELRVYRKHAKTVQKIIEMLPGCDPEASAKLVGDIPEDVNFDIDRSSGRRKILARMCLVYHSMKRTGVMYNPLHVTFQDDGFYYLTRGSQRYCALVALGNTDDVPCRVCGGFNDNRLINRFPYVEVPGLYQNRQEGK